MSITVTNIIGGTNHSKNPSIQGSEITMNMYLEKNGQTQYLKSCPGIRCIENISNDFGEGCQGTYVSSVGSAMNDGRGELFIVINDVLYRLRNSFWYDEIGALATGSRPVFCETGGERPLLLIADGVNLWYYNLKNPDGLHQIALPNRIQEQGVQISPSHVQCVAGSIIVNDKGTGYAYYSIPYPLSQEKRNVYDIVGGEVQYEGLEVKTKEVDSDQWVFLDDYGVPQYKNGESNSDSIEALYAIGSNLIVFGPKSVEFWQRGSNEYETWTRTSYTFNREIGLDATYSIASVNNNVCFLSNGMNAGRAAFMISGTSFNKISDTWLDEILDRSDTTNAIGFSYSRSNHSFYCLYLPNCKNERGDITPRTFCYDITSQTWGERSSRDIKKNIDRAWNMIYPVWFNNKTICGSIKNGNIYYLDDSIHVEEINEFHDTIPLIRVRQSSVILNNYTPFTLDELGVEMNTGTIKNYNANPSILLEVSDNGGYTFDNTVQESCGKTGEYSYRCKFMNLGIQRLCVIKLSFSENCDFVLSNVSMRISPLSYSI